MRTIPALQTLRRIWIQNYTWAEGGTLRWRSNEEIPPAALYISSPYDVDARYSQKRNTQWVGYKAHLTESCDSDQPHLITDVHTTPAPTADDAVTSAIHGALEQRGLLPMVHLVDSGFIDAELICDSQDAYSVDLFGPVRVDNHRQAREGQGFAAEHFVIEWEHERAICPAGVSSNSWTPAVDRSNNPVIKIKFSRRDCVPCSHHAKCTQSTRRTLTLRPKEQHLALQAARGRQQTPEFARGYAKRAGIEGTILTCGAPGTRGWKKRISNIWLSPQRSISVA